MNNYLLSIDPNIKNTGFILWENKKPIWVKSYSFEKFKNINWTFNEQIIFELFMISKIKHFDNMDLIIERGTFHSKNGLVMKHKNIIAGTFNKLLIKDMLISPKEWQNWYKNEYKGMIMCNGENIFYQKKWEKSNSELLCQELIKENNWNITISNHDEADSLLIGWYYLNKENK